MTVSAGSAIASAPTVQVDSCSVSWSGTGCPGATKLAVSGTVLAGKDRTPS